MQPGFGDLGGQQAVFLFALPGPVSVLGQTVWTPSRLLWQVVPAMRVPSRWSVVVMTALSDAARNATQARSVLRKPVGVDALLEVAHRYCRAASPPASP